MRARSSMRFYCIICFYAFINIIVWIFLCGNLFRVHLVGHPTFSSKQSIKWISILFKLTETRMNLHGRFTMNSCFSIHKSTEKVHFVELLTELELELKKLKKEWQKIAQIKWTKIKNRGNRNNLWCAVCKKQNDIMKS